MGFKKGNTFGKGRPKGSLNKVTQETKDFLKDLLFNPKQLKIDFQELDVNGRMELRCRLAEFVLPKQKQLEIENKTMQPILPEHIQAILETPEDKLPKNE